MSGLPLSGGSIIVVGSWCCQSRKLVKAAVDGSLTAASLWHSHLIVSEVGSRRAVCLQDLDEVRFGGWQQVLLIVVGPQSHDAISCW